MSKTTKKLLITLGILLMIPILFFTILYLWLFAIPNLQAKHRLSKEYDQIQIPSYMHLTNKQWTNGGIDNAAEWNYSYTSSQSGVRTYTDLVTALNKAGYTIKAAQSPQNSGAQIVYNGTSGLTIPATSTERSKDSISASKKNVYVGFNLDHGAVDAQIYESHNPGDQ